MPPTVGLPEGRVTMLFTDIEGSTTHLRRLGEAYASVLADQRRILRAAIAAHGGHEMGTEGDSFFVVFGSAADGVATAVEAQRALDANPWAGGLPVRVRMGLHCGELSRHDEGYVGLELNRAARIASTANGGQIVVSRAIVDAVEGLRVRDLGLHRLKDLPTPEALFQVLAEGVPDVTMALKSLGAASNLPAAPTRLVGRDEEVERVASLVAGGARLVTLTGPGGVGKTSLALAAAASGPLRHRFVGGGIYFVDLSGAPSADDALASIGAAIGAEGADGLASSGPTLLVLDNLEQLAEAAEVVAGVLDGAPEVVVLATSRGPLRLRAEHHVPVTPLGRPEAVELFVREARRVRPSFEPDDADLATVGEICRKVDGLPLAVELVASRVRRLGLDALAASLDERPDVASRDVDRPDRQRTLFATVAWSFDLLDAGLRAPFARLSVFAGGGGLAAAAAVLGVDEDEAFDLLDALADVSLVSFHDERVSMLHVVREFAATVLRDDPVEEAAARDAHAAHYVDVAEDAERRLHGADQLATGDRLALEHDNLRAAFEWSLSRSPSVAARIAAALGWFWYTHGRAADGRVWLERTATLADEVPPELAARTAQSLGVLQQQQGENSAALASFSRALELARSVGDRGSAARALNSLGITHWAEGRLDVARAHLEESVAIGRELADEQRVAAGLSNLGVVLLTAMDLDGAVVALREALAIDRRRADPWGIAVDQTNLGAALVRRGDLRQGVELIRSTLPGVVELGDPDLFASAVEACAMAAAIAGDARVAVSLVAGADRVRAAASAPRTPSEDAYLERELGPARAALSREAVAELEASASADEGDLLALVEQVASSLHGG